MKRNNQMWLLIALWLAVGGIALYRRQSPPSMAVDTFYTFAFTAVFILSLVHFYLRMKRTPPRD